MKKKKLLCIGLAVVMTLSAFTSCNSKEETHTLSMASEVNSYIEKVDSQYAYNIAKTLAYDDKYLSNKLGFRTAGSDAEHAAADYLANMMKGLGLEQVEKVPVEVDQWQFNSASLTVEGTDKIILPASYATNGTKKEGISATIVDVGGGTAADYEGKNVKGKIVLAGIDQWNVSWIDSVMEEAYHQGAAAIVTYNVGGYATIATDAVNMQDICGPDLMPCVSISNDDGLYLAKQIKAGKDKATLKVDNQVKINGGTSYNVIGKIKGKSDAQQIIISGHYDVYFNGFQDDSCAIGLILATAKAMKDSNYTPENDIIFVCHGSEEWGSSANQADWTTGAWEMINKIHPEWAGKTIAMLNFELPAFYDGAESAQISSVPEFSQVIKTFAMSDLTVKPEGKIYPKGLNKDYVPSNTMEDGISYRFAGVPYFVNIPGAKSGDKGWIQQRYHTVYDDKDTYSKEVMTYNLKTYGALAIYLDKTPAIVLDFTKDADFMKKAFNEEIAKGANVDVESYLSALEKMREAAEQLNKETKAINDAYEKAVAESASSKELSSIREKGSSLNKKSLTLFKYVQDNLIGVRLTKDVVAKHQVPQDNIQFISDIISALEKKNISNKKDGALDLAYQINGGAEYNHYLYSKATTDMGEGILMGTYQGSSTQWITDKIATFANTGEATRGVLGKAEEKNPDFTAEISIYKKALKEQQEVMKAIMTEETKAMNTIVDLIK